jgi:DNA-binding transcriptional MerR regulator
MEGEHHTIGEVLTRLKAEFDDVTISKIRFLEAEGLIAPSRSDSGYRQFTTPDVERLRYVLLAQRDRYLPLRVIREELARLDAGLPLEEAVTQADSASQGRFDPASLLGDVSLDRSELAQASGLDLTLVGALVEHGILPASPPYDGDVLRRARLCGELIRRGLEPRHLRGYRLAADREATLLEQLVGPLLRQRNPESRRRAHAQAEELVELGTTLHGMLLRERLAALLGR